MQLMNLEQTVLRELLIVKIKMKKGELSEIVEAAHTYRANVVDLSPESMLIEVTGEPFKLNAFLEYIKKYGIIEMSRTGPTGMGRGAYRLENQ